MLHAIEGAAVETVERLGPSVVRLRRYATLPGRGGALRAEGAGTGIIVDGRGYLVTNDHVVRGARELRVVLDDGREHPGSGVGEDPATDLAVVRIDGRDLPAAPLADSERLRVGQLALAIGNALGLPGGPTVSLGVISALGRPLPGADHVLEGLIQTDAAINPGNSGGPLANLEGGVVGVNSAVIPYAQGVGFAIPANTVRNVLDQIRTSGRVIRPWIGISGVNVDRALARRFGLGEPEGVLLAEVHPQGPAARSELRPGDVLTRLGSEPVRGLRDLVAGLSRLPIGGAIDFEYLREGRHRRSVLRIGEAPPPLLAE